MAKITAIQWSGRNSLRVCKFLRLGAVIHNGVVLEFDKRGESHKVTSGDYIVRRASGKIEVLDSNKVKAEGLEVVN